MSPLSLQVLKQRVDTVSVQRLPGWIGAAVLSNSFCLNLNDRKFNTNVFS